MRLIKSFDPDVIVSTYPGVTAVLGDLRRKRKLDVPCYSSITDLAGLHFWAHPGIDMHFITHPESIEEVEKIAGPGSVQWAKPPTSPAFLAARSRADARRSLGLPADGKVIAVSGGGWGVGDLVGATGAALQVPDATVLCLCGRNDELRAPRRAALPGRAAAAADGLHRPDGRRARRRRRADPLERRPDRARGDHPRLSGDLVRFRLRSRARVEPALQRFGLAQVARRERRSARRSSARSSTAPSLTRRFARRPSTASLILGNERHVEPLPALARAQPAGRPQRGGDSRWPRSTLTTGASYSLVSHFVHMKPVRRSPPAGPRSACSSTPPAAVPGLASLLAADGMHVSFALAQASVAARADAPRYGNQVVPRLPSGGLVRWLRARSELHRLLRRGSDHHFLYTSNGPSVGQWLVAHGPAASSSPARSSSDSADWLDR